MAIAQKIYNVIAKIKKNRMQGRNTVEEVLCLSAIRDYKVFYRNREDNNMLSNIVVAHPTSIEMLRTWPYVLIMDTTYKTNNMYNMPLLEVVGMTPTNRECGLMPMMGEVFSTTYHMLCRKHINQNVLAKLTELTKNEEVPSRFVNGSWKKLLDKIDEQEYLRKLDALKTKWKSRPDFQHYLFNNWLNPFAHKFTLEIGGRHPSARQQDKDFEMRSLTDLLHQISTGPISKSLKGGRRRTQKKETSHIGSTCQLLIEKYRSQADLFFVLALNLGRCPVWVLGRDPVGEGDRYELLGKGAEGATVAEKNVIGDRNYGYRVVADFVFGDEHQWPEVHVNELVHRIHLPVDGPAAFAHWFEIPNSLYIIANALNLCVILIAQLGSTTVLPLYSYSDRLEGTLVIGLLTKQLHFIQLNDMCPIPPLHVQWIHHRSEWVSNWVDLYQHRIADWNARVARKRK
ncbi:hypothetical protein M9H77_04265 [Catharanthus roseus]|uniref:Uncharacterized protein n=1 Tax=Catharanthus roseus TaxID=4058 RepID=A0ACC0CDW7_CATRO|nr:hypothetical protein M9H77_04265 [Catharanthus roseus]